jgi:hypothetical protein
MGNTKQDRSRVAKLQPHEIQTLKRKFKTDKGTVLEAISLSQKLQRADRLKAGS